MDNEIKCKMKEKRTQKPANMHGHPAQFSNIVIPRKFRWTLNSTTHPDIHWWMKSIKTDYVNKRLIIEVFDDAKGIVYNWIQALINKNKDTNNVTLTHLDGYSKPIYLIDFIDLKIDEHITDYNYSSSEVLTHKITISYKSSKRINQLDVN